VRWRSPPQRAPRSTCCGSPGSTCARRSTSTASRPRASAVLGFAVREGATNILRHADARHCTIHALRQDGVIRLELVNDGAGTRRTHGTGLQNLADRLAELDGRAAGGPLGGGRFRLRVEVPA
jgi:two-component system sensor histidine kinase DesK